MYEQQLLQHGRNLLQLLGVHQQVGLSGWVLRGRVRSVLRDLQLHLWLHGLHQQHLREEPGLPQQLHAHQHWVMFLHH